ncbi:unnamed protein product, partial [Tetraodon nigroviridis]
SSRPFHVERRNIVDEDLQERVSAEAAILNSRLHYYGRLTGSSDRLLVPLTPSHPVRRRSTSTCPLGTAFKVGGSEASSRNPSIVTIFAVWNTMMGTSILSIPWGLKQASPPPTERSAPEAEACCLSLQAGFTLGILILVFTGLLMLYCCYIVLQAPKSIPYVDTSNWEFPDVCRYYFGQFGQWSSLVFSMVSLVGAMVIYWVLMSNFLYNAGQFVYNYAHNVNVSDSTFGTNGSDKVSLLLPSGPWGGNSTPSMLLLRSSSSSSNASSDVGSFQRWWSKCCSVPLYLVVLLLPLLCFRSAAFFARFTPLGTLSVVYLIVLVTVKAVHLGFHLEFHWFQETQFYVPGEGSSSAAPESLHRSPRTGAWSCLGRFCSVRRSLEWSRRGGTVVRVEEGQHQVTSREVEVSHEEFRLLFPQLTGVLTLAFFIHNCIITLMKSNRHQENNASLMQQRRGLRQGAWSPPEGRGSSAAAEGVLVSAGAGPVGGLPPGWPHLPLRWSADLCCFPISPSLQRVYRAELPGITSPAATPWCSWLGPSCSSR